MLLLEQGQLSCGTTWHAAGLVGQLRASESGTRLVQYSTELYAGSRQETGLSTGFKRCGGVTVARTEDRMIQLRRTAATAEAFDLECELITPAAGARAVPDHAGRRPGRGDLAARRRQGQPDRPDLRAGQGRPRRGAHGRRADQGDRHPRPRDGRGHRRAHRRRRRRGRDRGQLRGPVGQAGRRDVRGDRAAALGRALLRRHRPDRRRAPGPPDPARPRRLHLLQGGGRRPGRRRLRARGQAVGRRRTRCPTRSSSSCWTRTGTTSRS